MATKEKNKLDIKKIIISICFIFGGFAFGFFGKSIMENFLGNLNSLINKRMSFFVEVIVIAICILLHIVIHELGHMLCGLMTGYKFSSFRILSFMIVKKDDKLQLKSFSIPGTMGQCIMEPPTLINGRMPTVLYFLGGSIMNFLTSLVAIVIMFALKNVQYIPEIMIYFVVIGILDTLINAIPINSGVLVNDGYNAVAIRKNDRAIYAFWVQLMIQMMISHGVRLKDMPDEWFEIPSDEDNKNVLISAIGVFACNRLMDEHKFEECDKLMEKLLKTSGAIAGIYISLITIERMFIELISQNRKNVIDEMYTSEIETFIKSMKTYPPLIRFQYAYALLYEKDENKARDIMNRFNKCSKKHPYPIEIVTEMELIEIVDSIYKNNKC